MHLSTGVDLIEIDRVHSAVQRHGERFLGRIYTFRERQETGEKIESLAARFAAKEAVAKALGTGIGQVKWTEIEVIFSQSHKPVLRLSGNAARLAKELGLSQWSISLSHTRAHAIAMAVAISSAEE